VAKPKLTLHVVWAPNVGPLVAYRDPTKAWQHARTILGVDVTAVELRDKLPGVVQEDIASDFDGDADDETPPMAGTPELAMARTRTRRSASPPADAEISVAVDVHVDEIDEG